jgi:hypothetical protein
MSEFFLNSPAPPLNTKKRNGGWVMENNNVKTGWRG